jgi:hypothetical protein
MQSFASWRQHEPFESFVHFTISQCMNDARHSLKQTNSVSSHGQVSFSQFSIAILSVSLAA